MRKITIEVQTDSKEPIETIKKDIEMELGCCSTNKWEKAWTGLKGLILRMTKNDKCFERHSKNGKCYGLCGGDKHSSFLSYDCVSCCHLTMLVGGDEIALH